MDRWRTESPGRYSSHEVKRMSNEKENRNALMHQDQRLRVISSNLVARGLSDTHRLVSRDISLRARPFDDPTYEQLKPHFIAGMRRVKKSGMSLGDALR